MTIKSNLCTATALSHSQLQFDAALSLDHAHVDHAHAAVAGPDVPLLHRHSSMELWAFIVFHQVSVV